MAQRIRWNATEADHAAGRHKAAEPRPSWTYRANKASPVTKRGARRRALNRPTPA